MILKYVLKNFSRRKVRTILMILSLMVSTGLVVTMSATVETVRKSNVDLIASAVGRYDLSVSKVDTALDPFINISEVAPQIQAADPNITGVYPRIMTDVELDVDGRIGQGTMVALDPAVDDIGFIDVEEGSYELGNNHVAILDGTADTYGLGVGDILIAAYNFPFPREVGEEAVEGASQRRTTESFEISAVVRQDGVVGGGVREGFIISLEDAQNWLGLPGRSQSLIATVNPTLYESSNAEVAALEVRDVVRAVQTQLGDEFNYNLDKAAILSEVALGFQVLQALINTYGVIALGIVGLLVHTLVMTNVQEQRRDMAILRILGSQRNFLFILVIAEVITIGVIGVALGVVLGQGITRFIVVPLIQNQMAMEGITSPLVPQVSVGTLMPVIVASFAVLIISSLKPAQDAAQTKVMHAINPGVADNIQIEDLAQLRERRPDSKMFLAGLSLMLIFVLIAGFQVADTFGNPALEVMFVLLALGLLVLGLGLMFFITTVPFERLVLVLMGLIMPRLTYFARRNVGRGQTRNTLISLLVLFSGVLPSFLATQVAMEDANFEATVRQNIGSEADMQVISWLAPDAQADSRFNSDFRTEELATVPGINQTVGLTYGYNTTVGDTVGFRRANFTIYGVDGFLNQVLFTNLMIFVAGGPEALDALPEDPEAIIISEGLAEHLAVTLGDTIKVQGEGTDHVVNARIIGIARTIPSLNGIVRSRTTAANGSDALMSFDGFRSLITPLNEPLPPMDSRLLQRIAIDLTPDASPEAVVDEMSDRFRDDYQVWFRSLDVQIEENRRSQAIQRIFLLVMTTISFTTAVFGVFAVIYVTIYSRRLEIGMMKAIGMRRRELTGMLIVESITMTLGAALAGIAAGAAMGYIAFYADRALSQRPADFAFDTTVVPFIVIMVTLASILGAAFSARRIVTKRAVEILRM